LFMDPEIKTWLFDVLQSIAEIESYFEGRPKRFDVRRIITIFSFPLFELPRICR